MRRIAVLGASGLAGTAVCEHLVSRGRDEVVPFVRSSGNAWRLARRGIRPRLVDCRDRGETVRALRDCSHVVNCVLGDGEAMTRGLRNILGGAVRHRVEGFVHLSSVAVFGEPPPPEAATEHVPRRRPPRGTYGRMKLEQDRVVRRAARSGLPVVILCPPNIGGPYSHFFTRLTRALGAGTLPLVGEGAHRCNLVDTRNLAQAVELALDHGSREAPFYFITDAEGMPWSRLLASLGRLAPDRTPARISIEAARAILDEAEPEPRSFVRSLTHLGSSEVRAALRRDPLWADVDALVRKGIRRMGRGVERRLQPVFTDSSGNGAPLSVGSGNGRSDGSPQYSAPLIRQQLRTVVHSCGKAKRDLGYAPEISSECSVDAFVRRCRVESGMDSEMGELLGVLQA